MSKRKQDRRSRANDRRSRANAEKSQLYGLAYGMALKRVSPLQKRIQPDLPSWLHDFVRHEIKEGTTDPSVIVAKALEALNKRVESGI